MDTRVTVALGIDHVTPSPPNPFSLAPRLQTFPHSPLSYDRPFPPHGQVTLSHRTPILMAEDTQISQDILADATNARHIEDPVDPSPTRRTQPLTGSDRVSIGKYYCSTQSQSDSFRAFHCFFSFH